MPMKNPTNHLWAREPLRSYGYFHKSQFLDVCINGQIFESCIRYILICNHPVYLTPFIIWFAPLVALVSSYMCSTLVMISTSGSPSAIEAFFFCLLDISSLQQSPCHKHSIFLDHLAFTKWKNNNKNVPIYLPLPYTFWKWNIQNINALKETGQGKKKIMWVVS